MNYGVRETEFKDDPLVAQTLSKPLLSLVEDPADFFYTIGTLGRVPFYEDRVKGSHSCDRTALWKTPV